METKKFRLDIEAQPLKILLQFASRFEAVGLLLLMILTGLTEGIGVLLLVPFLNSIAGGNDSSRLEAGQTYLVQFYGLEPSVGLLLSTFVFLVLVRSGLQYWRDKSGSELQYKMVDGLRVACFGALLRAEWRWITDKRVSNHADILLNDVSRIGVGLHHGVGLLASVATLFFWICAALLMSWKMTFIALFMGMLLLWFLSEHRRDAVKLGSALSKANKELHSRVHESLQGLRLAKILECHEQFLSQFVHVLSSVREQQKVFLLSTSSARIWSQVVGSLVLSMYLYYGLAYGHVPTAELLALVVIFARLIPLLMQGHHQLHQCLHAWPVLKEITCLLSECIKNSEHDDLDVADRVLIAKREIRVQGLTIKFSRCDTAVLNEVSFVLPVKTTTAVIGPSGSGKSTLADVLAGLLLPDFGTLSVDGRLIDQQKRKAWRSSVAYVQQDPFLFHGSVRQNLQMANLSATEEECIKVLQMAAADFVFQLPQGLDTIVGDGGTRLSGGERQRIGLARALLLHPTLLILDEATSALDIDNELKICKALEGIHGEVTTLIIGHRLATLAHADQVLRLEAGEIVASGTWAEINA